MKLYSFGVDIFHINERASSILAKVHYTTNVVGRSNNGSLHNRLVSRAYFVGCRYGKHKLAPVISPNKSVEGVFGGILFAVVGMLLYSLIMQLGFHFRVNYAYVILYGVVGSICGVFGDLCFSVIKRQTGLKDYGNLIPGHGGVLDRFDSMIVVGPAIELMLELLPMVM